MRTLNNTNARAGLFADPVKVAGGDDALANAGVDDADVFFVHTHGSHSDSSPRSSLVMGTNADGCSARTNTHMRLGTGKLDIAIVKACQSGNIEVWELGDIGSSSRRAAVASPCGTPSTVTRRAATR